jgi:hypothetical protein
MADRQGHRAGLTRSDRARIISRRLDAAAGAPLRAGRAPSGLLALDRQVPASRICKHIYPRVGRGAVAVFEVESNEVLHRILNEWADIIPAEFDVYPLVDLEATHKMLAAQVAANKKD